MCDMQLVCAESGSRAAFFSRAGWLWRLTLAVGLACLIAPGSARSAGVTAADIRTWQAEAQRGALHQSETWQALLHLRDGKPQIPDEDFLLSLPEFTPERELAATLAHLYGPQSAQAVCRYPARYLWLQRALKLPELPLAPCQQLQEFLSRAPAERISLVFASENLSQPSSMMGHLFLKLEGPRADGAPVAHAVAFFTDADTVNLPKLFFDSMVVGKQGYFVLTPFQDEVNLYAVAEQRSLWEYELKLDTVSRLLMQAHMHELRQSRITYFFQDYNCATLVQHILAVAEPNMLSGKAWWTTPKGVVQRAQAVGLVSNRSVTTPSRWRIRALRESMTAAQVDAVRVQVQSRQTDGMAKAPAHTQHDVQQGFLALELARAYNAYLFEQKHMARTDWLDYSEQLKQIQQQRYAGLELNTLDGKDPANAPPDRQVSLGWQHWSGEDELRLGLQPVSHALVDDNRQLFSESELRLFDSAALVRPRDGRVTLAHFTLYAVQSLLPYDSMTGGLSGRFKIGVEPQAQLQQPNKKALLIEGAAGYTWRLTDDIDAFALIGGGWGFRKQGYLYTQPSMGVVLREVFDMKTVLQLSRISSPLGQQQSSQELSFSQIKHIDRQHSVWLEWRHTRQGSHASDQGLVMLKHLF
jgi:Domain of unknown function (DUF4105)